MPGCVRIRVYLGGEFVTVLIDVQRLSGRGKREEGGQEPDPVRKPTYVRIKMRGNGWFLVWLLLLIPAGGVAQEGEKAETVGEDPGRWIVPESAEFARALRNGTRGTDGGPGPNYWQQWARYDLVVELVPATQTLRGSAEIWYYV